MNDFRPKPKNRPVNSIDGFVTGKQPRANDGRGNLRTFDQYYRPARPSYGPSGQPFSQKFKQSKTGSVPGEVRRIDTFGTGTSDGFKEISAANVGFNKRHRSNESEITRAFGEPVAQAGISKHTSGRTGRKKLGLFHRKKRADKHHKHHKHPKRRVVLRMSAAFGVLLLLVGSGLALRAFLTGRSIFKGGGNSTVLHNQNVDPSQLKGEGDGRVNILVMGKGGEEQSDGPDLTDTIIVASIDPIAKEAALLSIPRDFWVKSPGGYQSKINEVYANAKNASLNSYPYKERSSSEAKDKSEQAGIDALKKVVSDSMGIPLHYYAMIDFAGFRKAIDTVGGIDINVPQDLTVREVLWISGRNYTLDVREGWQHFDGFRALAFSRSRKTSSRGDFARADRQRAVILGLKDKILNTGTLANPIKVNQLMSDFGGQLATDFSINEMLRLYDLGKEIPGDKVVSVGLDEHVGGSTINGLSVQVPKAGLFDYTEIQNYVRNIMRDAFLKKENARVMILNGTTTAGLATKKSAELKSYGYNVTSVGDAPTSNYTDTVLIDLRNGSNKYTLNYLEKRLGVKATGSLSDSSIDASGADFVIILGQQ